jgi:hemerythrin
MVFEWDTRYETGIPEIDAAHRELVNLINEVFESMATGHSKDIFGVLDQLQAYASSHFSQEVAYMEQTAYPYKDQHVWAHEKFIRRLKKFQDQKDENPMILTIRVAVYLNEWLQKHLFEEDRKLFIHVGSIPPPIE